MTSSVRARLLPLLRHALVALLVTGVAFFFWRAIRQNWAQIQAHQFRLDYPLLLLSFGTALAAGLLGTYAWQVALNGLSGKSGMSFARSVATVNSTSLTKYLPGKFWSYALQMYWLSRAGYPKALVLYVNLTNLIVSLLTGVALAVGFLLPTGRFPLPIVVGAFVLLLLADAICIRYYDAVFRLAGRVVKTLFKRELGYFQMSTPLLLRVHAIQFMAQLISGVGGYVLAFAIGYELDSSSILLVMASLILSDAAGFVFFLVPGGLGIREATMYLLLQGSPSRSLALVFPLVSRAIYMLADLLLGLVALALLRTSVSAAEASAAEANAATRESDS